MIRVNQEWQWIGHQAAGPARDQQPEWMHAHKTTLDLKAAFAKSRRLMHGNSPFLITMPIISKRSVIDLPQIRPSATAWQDTADDPYATNCGGSIPQRSLI